ncbi:hypothetical protein [Brevibacterium samyangense]|uniref:Uncharacterized protein n=1 Tax=Brevibacterium samyangense TaxID=366888 RepID=A0ABP5ELW6_9MICO
MSRSHRRYDALLAEFHRAGRVVVPFSRKRAFAWSIPGLLVSAVLVCVAVLVYPHSHLWAALPALAAVFGLMYLVIPLGSRIFLKKYLVIEPAGFLVTEDRAVHVDGDEDTVPWSEIEFDEDGEGDDTEDPSTSEVRPVEIPDAWPLRLKHYEVPGPLVVRPKYVHALLHEAKRKFS